MKTLHVNIGLLVLIFSLTVAGSINQSFKPHYKLETPKSSAGEITIVTPENKTYTEPDIGYYPATYGFENDIISAPPQGLSSEVGSGTTIEVIDQLDGHNMITRLNDEASGTSNYANLSYIFSPRSSGFIEFWFRRSGVSEVIFIELWNESLYCLSVYSEDRGSGLAFEYYNGIDYVTIMFHNINLWYHHRLEFNCTSGTFDWYIDGVLRGDDLLLRDPTPYFVRFTVRTRGWGSTGYNVYLDGIGISWDPNYNIGDNLNEGLLLSYDNATTLDWQGYSLDGEANKTILGNKTIPMPNDGFHSIQVFGNDSIGTMYESNVKYFAVNAVTSINIITPEDITYYEPMSGYYPATYGFENDTIGSEPSGVDKVIEVGCSLQVIGEIAGHKNVVEFDDQSNTGNVELNIENSFWVVSNTFEFYIRITDASKHFGCGIYYISPNQRAFFKIDSYKFQHYDGTYHDVGHTASSNTWYHIRVIHTSANWYLYIDGLEYGPFGYQAAGGIFNGYAFGTNNPFTNYQGYVDAIGFASDVNYAIGSNLNEGLLLSYFNTTNMEWVGYSLDGSPNITITGNKVIPFPEIGPHSIVLNGITSIGMLTKSELRYFTIDIQDPPIPPEIPSPFPIIPIILASIGIGIIALLSITIILLRRRISSRTSSTIISHKKSQLDDVVDSGSDQFKVCPFCRTQIKKNNQFCTYCGASLKED